MELSMTPWEHHPALSRDRLIAIAQLIVRGRNLALDRFDPDVGCTGWTLGCEAFAFQRHQIVRAAADTDWLEILNPTMQFVFTIGDVPARFYRGEPEDPNTRTLKQTFSELQQLSLFGADELVKLTAEPLYRFAVETDLDGSTTAITFVILGGEMPVLTWSIPLDEPVTKISPLWVEGSEGVELPAPSVGIPTKKKKDGTSD
ncbi:hypothetical protein [Novosphingobium sp. CF614]|uniref:hypothetical protein n=1 Tax=Novosphingobium sp. CF614 TaxID=1884364 RepID=UPI00116065C1|nr:hypothetical protein [Novosphingobium sp. CF614]